MKPKSRVIITPLTGEAAGQGYLVRARRTGLILGTVWRTFGPRSSDLKRGWCAYDKIRRVYPTRRAAALALL